MHAPIVRLDTSLELLLDHRGPDGPVALATIVATAVRTARTREYVGLLFLLIFVAFSFTESFLEQHNSLFWVLFIATMTHALGPLDDRPPERKAAPRRPLAPTKPSLARGGAPSWYS